jgi:vacuolar-type H+-ATPase subunit I/STV1
MTARQFRRLTLLLIAGLLLTEVTVGFGLRELGVSWLWCLIVLAFLTLLSGGGNWLTLRSLRKSLARTAAQHADRQAP